ncbi:unnamed protein product [Symbiodinium natans]|uniref:Uncharacterized protein n=1 Tax=Symbiodinium natans TaxID=878477 RepID=A0A812SZL7_9DINO|nr:unnamed protein product [Symbiodinium natans]
MCHALFVLGQRMSQRKGRLWLEWSEEVLAALAAPTEPSPFEEERKREALELAFACLRLPSSVSSPVSSCASVTLMLLRASLSPLVSEVGRRPAAPRPKRAVRRTLESNRRSRVGRTDIRDEVHEPAKAEARSEAKPETKPEKPGAKTEAKPKSEAKAKDGDAKANADVAESPHLGMSQLYEAFDAVASAPWHDKNTGKKTLFSAVKALMQVAREEDQGQKLAQMLGAVSDRRSASPSVESDLQSRQSRQSDLTDSRRGSPEPGGRRKSSSANKSQRSQATLVKAAAAFKSALSAAAGLNMIEHVAGATDTTTGGNRRLSVAERMAMTSGSRPTDKDKESAEERSDSRQAQAPPYHPKPLQHEHAAAQHGDQPHDSDADDDHMVCSKAGQEAEVAQKPETPVHEFASQRRERGQGHWKWQSQPFEAPLCSFQELVNVENNPTPLSEAMERVRSLAGGQNFTWERSSGAHGGRCQPELARAVPEELVVMLHISFPIVLWYQHSWENEIKKSRPTVPVTTLLIEPKQLFRPMFQLFVFLMLCVFVQRHYLDFGSTDYRVIVGGSHYREALASRKVVSKLEDPPELWSQSVEQVPIICIDSFVALSALLFSPERQVLYAGVDPTPSYLRWLQYIGDQYNFHKALGSESERALEGRCAYALSDGIAMSGSIIMADQAIFEAILPEVFEMNEFLDFPAVIIFYGRPQHRGRESDPLAWVNSPSLIKGYIARYSEDNKCSKQQAFVGPEEKAHSPGTEQTGSEKIRNDAEKWYCWNGLKVCEIGVPVPHTQASFLSPFVITRLHFTTSAAKGWVMMVMGLNPHLGDCLWCRELTGGDGEEQDKATRGGPRLFANPVCFISQWLPIQLAEDDAMATDPQSLVSNVDGGLESGAPSEVASEAGDDEDSDSRKSWSFNTQMGGFGGGPSPRTDKAPGLRCSCGQYIHASQQGVGKKDKQAKSSQGDGMVATGMEAQEVRQALSALGEYDLLHTFVGLMSGGLNMAKSVLRLHFSIDPGAYQNLPEPACKQWEVGLMPWYREFHRMDMHSRSRHGMLLASILRGMLGDGLTSGLHDESLDMLRLPLPMCWSQYYHKRRHASRVFVKLPASLRSSKGSCRRRHWDLATPPGFSRLHVKEYKFRWYQTFMATCGMRPHVLLDMCGMVALLEPESLSWRGGGGGAPA